MIAKPQRIPQPSQRVVGPDGLMNKIWYDWLRDFDEKFRQTYPYENTATYDPPSLADGAGTTTTVTVTGAALGDMAQASFSLATSGITISAWVSAADTVSVRFQNESGGVLDIASGTLKAWVLK